MRISKRTIGRRGLWALAVAAGLAACGGGELLLIAVVTPLNGQWRDQTPNSVVGVNFVNLNAQQYLYQSTFQVEGELVNPSGVCAGTADANGNLPLNGTIDNGRLVLNVTQTGQVCVDGRFTDLRRLEAAVGSSRGTRVFLNDRIDVRLTEGVWVSEGGGSVRLKFDNDIGGSFNDSVDNNSTTDAGGCDVSPGVGTPIPLTGTLEGFGFGAVNGVGGRPKPAIATFTPVGGNTPRFRDLVFEDGATLSLRTASGQAVTLKRQRETTPSSCN